MRGVRRTAMNTLLKRARVATHGLPLGIRAPVGRTLGQVRSPWVKAAGIAVSPRRRAQRRPQTRRQRPSAIPA